MLNETFLSRHPILLWVGILILAPVFIAACLLLGMVWMTWLTMLFVGASGIRPEWGWHDCIPYGFAEMVGYGLLIGVAQASRRG